MGRPTRNGRVVARMRRAVLPVLGALALAAYVAGIAVWVTLGLDPSAGRELRRSPLAAWADPTAWSPILAVAVVGIVAFLALGHGPALRAGRSSIAAGVLGVSAALIGLATFWPCSTGQSYGWTALRRSLDLVRGNVEWPTGAGGACTAATPLGLQAAQLMMLSALGIIAWRAIGLIFASRFAELRARTARAVLIVAGLDDVTVDVVRHVRRSVPGRVLTVVLAAPSDGRSRELARELRGVVVPADPLARGEVRRLAAGRRRSAVRGLCLLGPDTADNLRALETVRGAFRAPRVASSPIPARALVRIDNPWQADDWRRRHMAADADWLVDAVSAVEGAARAVVRQVRDSDTATVVLTDTSPFELSVLSELALQHRLDDGAPVPRIVLTGARAAEIEEHFLAQLGRFGITARGLATCTAASVDEVMEGAGSAALLVAYEDDDDGVRSSFVAARRPDWTIFAWDPRAHGLAPTPLIGGLTTVGPTLEPTPGRGVDTWDWLGRAAHERYLRAFLGAPVLGDPSRGRWEEDLSPFTREANIRPFRAVIRGVRVIGVRWATTLAGPEARTPIGALTAEEKERLDRAEHDSWVDHHRLHGWRFDVQRNDRRRRHPSMVPWDELSPEDRAKDAGAVTATLELLEAVGFTMQREEVRAADAPRGREAAGPLRTERTPPRSPRATASTRSG